jgi:hypothetical protein
MCVAGKVKFWFLLNLAFEGSTPDFMIGENRMRKISGVTVAMILAIAFYFTLFWGYDALHVLTSPTYGLEDVWRSQYIFGIGRLLGLEPSGLIQLAAFFGVLKLAVAGICAIHIIDRLRSFAGGNANAEIFEGALILVVLIAIASAGAAVWSQNVDLVREQAIQLAIAGLAIALVMVERNYGRPAKPAAPVVAAVPQGARWFTPWR